MIPAAPSSGDSFLAAAAHLVVYKAALRVAAKSSMIQSSPIDSTKLSIQDVSTVTLSAVAEAVDIVGPLASEVDVMATASELLSQQMVVPSHMTGVIPTSIPSLLVEPVGL